MTSAMSNFKQNLTLLIYMIDAASMQAATIKDAQEWRHAAKQYFNQYFAAARAMTRKVTSLMADDKAEAYDNRAAYVYEIMQEAARTKKPDELLALIKSYNNGQVEVR
jgi:hypothetical protein